MLRVIFDLYFVKDELAKLVPLKACCAFLRRPAFGNSAVYGSLADYYCHRTYTKLHRGTNPNRAAFIDSLSNDRTLRKSFQKDVDDGVYCLKDGGRNIVNWKERQTKLEVVDDNTRKVIKPKRQFFPLTLYKNTFDHPISKENKKKGHIASIEDRVAGVLAPATLDSKPWEVEESVSMTKRRRDVLGDDFD